jgi:hypothetical protein
MMLCSITNIVTLSPEITVAALAQGSRIFKDGCVTRDTDSPLLAIYHRILTQIAPHKVAEISPQLGYAAGYLDTPYRLSCADISNDSSLWLDAHTLKTLLNQQILELSVISMLRSVHSETSNLNVQHKLLDRISRFYEDEDGWIDSNYADPMSGWNVLHWAANLGFDIVVQDLIKTYRSDPNRLTYLDETPLLLASRNNHSKCWKYLNTCTSDLRGYLSGAWTPVLYQSLNTGISIIKPINGIEQALSIVDGDSDTSLFPPELVTSLVIQQSSGGALLQVIPRLVETLPPESQDIFTIFLLVIAVGLFHRY